MYYTSEQHKVSGTILGEAVSGFGGLDQCWLPAGVTWFQSKTFLNLYDYWFYWANRYADGSTDYGLAFHGPGNSNLCFYGDEGKASVSTETEVEFNIRWAAEGYPEEINIKTGSHQFRWTCDSRATPMPQEALGWTTGRVINLSKKDLPVEGNSNIEYHVKK